MGIFKKIKKLVGKSPGGKLLGIAQEKKSFTGYYDPKPPSRTPKKGYGRTNVIRKRTKTDDVV